MNAYKPFIEAALLTGGAVFVVWSGWKEHNIYMALHAHQDGIDARRERNNQIQKEREQHLHGLTGSSRQD